MAHVAVQLLVPAAARRLVGYWPHEQRAVVVPLRILQARQGAGTLETNWEAGCPQQHAELQLVCIGVQQQCLIQTCRDGSTPVCWYSSMVGNSGSWLRAASANICIWSDEESTSVVALSFT